MQQVKINNDIYEIPISWSELNYWQACQVLKHLDDKGKQLSLLAKIPMQLIEIMPNNQAQVLFDLISFTENLEVFNEGEVLDKYKDFDYGGLEYGKAEKCKQIMSKDISGYEATAEIIQYLFNEDINAMPFLEVIGSSSFFLSRLMASILVSPSLEKVKLAMSKCKQGSSDYLALEGLVRMLKSQGVAHLEQQ